MSIYDECPRCATTKKYERPKQPAPLGTCWSWWHQYVWLPNIWPERIATFKPVSTPTIVRPL